MIVFNWPQALLIEVLYKNTIRVDEPKELEKTIRKWCSEYVLVYGATGQEIDGRIVERIGKIERTCNVVAVAASFTACDYSRLAKAGVSDALKANDPALRRLIEESSQTYRRLDEFSSIITADVSLLHQLQEMRTVAGSRQPVLITGETGTGKELVAHAIHKAGGRKGRYVVENAAGLDDLLFSDSLFGHSRGAFTGATGTRAGLVKKADGGTLFLDEIGDLSAHSQLKLLRLIENGEYYPLGNPKLHTCDVQFVFATNRDLRKMADRKEFRNDLLFRLSGYHLHLPPLRQRIDDIPLLTRHFVSLAATELGKEVPAIGQDAIDFLQSLPWHGNVRELKSRVFNAVLINDDGELKSQAFADPLRLLALKTPQYRSPKSDRLLSFAGDLPDVETLSLDLVIEAIRRANGNQSEAARLLGVTPSAVNKRLSKARAGRKLIIEKYGSDLDDFPTATNS